MTTQAQIEAAARAAYEKWIDHVRDLELPWSQLPADHKERLFDAQAAALTAAAEVGQRPFFECPQCGNDLATVGHKFDCTWTAAAEVGEPKLQFELNAIKAELQFADEQINRIKGATIEHCAQVAENCELSDIDRDSPRTAIAAAIRALKSTP